MVNPSRGVAEWELEIGGLTLPLVGALEIGRDPECDLPLEDERASWRHLRITAGDGELEIIDLESRNGTYVNGRRMASEPIRVTAETVVQLGGTRARLRRAAAEIDPRRGFRRLPIRGRLLRIGRGPDNDLCLDEPNVSWHHAQLRPGDPPTLVDLGSRNGVRLGEQMISGRALLPPGEVAGIGPFSLHVERGELVVVDERGGQHLSAHEVSVGVPGRTILRPTSFSVAPGEFVALIGASGSGKTTLLKSLAGVRTPSSGTVLVGSDPIELRSTEVGYVPQSDILHDRLSVRETLGYTARLRLPSDTPAAEREMAVGEVLEELRLGEHADTPVQRLSGGQRKRVSCGVELIGKPTMLLLDEPTSGLDPPLERRLMTTLRRLADAGRGVVVVTHATSSLVLCDTVAVMGEGGRLLFGGSPAECLDEFGVGAYDEIYGAAELVPAVEGDPAASPAPRSRHPAGGLLSGQSLLRQSVTLVGRYARTLSRDRRTIGALLGQAPLIGLLICLLYPADVLATPDLEPTRSAQFIFLLVTAALWLGLIDSCREIVKERAIIVRELAVGVRLDAQLIAKAIVLFTIAAAQCALLLGVVAVLRPLHLPPTTYLALGAVLTLTSWSMVGMGLLVSTVARSVDQATSVIPLLLIPQLLFGGALVALERMSTVIRVFADLAVSRWAFAGAGSVVHTNDRLAEDPKATALSGYGASFFGLDPAIAGIVLAGFTALAILGAALVLARRNQEA